MTKSNQVTLMGLPGDDARKAMFWLIAITTIFRLIGAGSIDLILGESYYLASARMLHWSYFDQPPLSLWVMWATNTLFQTDSSFVLRVPFVLMFSISTWVIYRIGARYRSEWAGFFAALVMNISILFSLSIGSWLQPEAPLMLFWLLTCWALIDIFFGEDDNNALRKWLWVGVLLGFTFLSKYHAIFLIFGAGIYALTSAQARKWILHPGPYLAILIAAAISSPVLIWNIQNDWVSFGFQGGRALGAGFRIDWLLRMIIGQLLYIVPWLAIPGIIAALIALTRGPSGRFPQDTPKGFGWFLVCMAFGPIVFFTAVSAWSDSQFHFHWQAPGYMMLFILMGGWIDAAWPRHKLLNQAWLGTSATITFVILTVLISHTATGWMRNVVPNGQTFEDPTGVSIEWREITSVFDEMLPKEQGKAFVAALTWETCGQVDKPVAGRAPVACFSTDPRNMAFNTNLRDMVGRDAYFADKWVTLDGVSNSFVQFFESFELIATRDIHRNGFPEIKNISVVKATGFDLIQQFEALDQPTITVTRLPRTRIVRLSGELMAPANDTQLNILIDDIIAGTISASSTSFDIAVENDRATVGISNPTIALLSEDGRTAQVNLRSLDVQLD